MAAGATSEREERAWLRATREKLGLSRRHLAERIGVREETVESWERGINAPRPGKRPELAAELGMTLRELEHSLGVAPSQQRRSARLVVLNPNRSGNETGPSENVVGDDLRARQRLFDVVTARLDGDSIDSSEFERLLRVAFELSGLRWPIEDPHPRISGRGE